MPPCSMAFWTRSSEISISFNHSVCGMRPGFTGPFWTMEKLSYSISPRNAALMPVHSPSSTPTAHMASNRRSRRA